MALPQHCCPGCGREVPFSRLWVPVRAGIWVRWRCPGCDTVLRFDASRRWLAAVIVIPWVILLVLLYQAGTPLMLVVLGAVPALLVLHFVDRVEEDRPPPPRRRRQRRRDE